MSTTASYSYTTGELESTTETHTDSREANITVQPHSSKTAIITSSRYVMDVPYTAIVTPEYTNGTIGTTYTYKGIYKGVKVNDIDVIYEADVPIMSWGDSGAEGLNDCCLRSCSMLVLDT